MRRNLVWFTMLLGLMLGAGFNVSAQNELNRREILSTVHYQLEDSILLPGYENNRQVMDSIADRVIRFGNADARDRVFRCIRISSATSPEGRKTLNDSLAISRSEQVLKFLKNIPGTLYEQVIFSTRLSPDWDGFTRQVLSGDPKYTHAATIWSILRDRQAHYDDTVEDPIINEFRAEREAWKAMKEIYFPELRYARVEFLRDTIIPDKNNVLAKPYDPVCFTEDSVVYETVSRNVDVLYPRFWFALKSNVLFDAAGALNGSIEIPVGKRWSILGEVVWPWWLGTRDTWCEQLGHANLEARYWFNRERGNGKTLDDKRTYNPLTGFFLGGTAGWGYYDFETHKNGYQGEFVMAGITGGYALRLHKYWNLEFALGVGYVYTKYRKYDALDINGDRELIRVGKEKKHLIAPVKAQISISYLLTTKSKKTEKRYETIKRTEKVTRCY